jgi:hypothetical protein
MKIILSATILALAILVMAVSAVASAAHSGSTSNNRAIQAGLNSGRGQPNYLSNPLIDKFYSEHYGGMKFNDRREKPKSFSRPDRHFFRQPQAIINCFIIKDRSLAGSFSDGRSLSPENEFEPPRKICVTQPPPSFMHKHR